MTTAHFPAAYPFAAEGSLGAPGTYIGRDAHGGPWLYDPWSFYERELIGGTNMLTLGAISRGKSALIKSYLYRQAVFGRQAWVLDPKGEYGPLAEAMGTAPVRLMPGGAIRLNPLTTRGGRDAQLSLLRSVAQAALRRDLNPEEDAGLRVGLEAVNRDHAAGGEPTLPMVVDALLHPSESMIAGVSASSAAAFAKANRDSALALQRLCEGDLRGMFDGPTSANLDLDGPLVVLDLSAVEDSAALGILMTCAAAWLQAIALERKRSAEAEGRAGRKIILVLDEAWRIAGHIGVAEWLQANFKLCRTQGIQTIVIAHRLTDFGAVGQAGSREARIVEGLIADADTKVLYEQKADQLLHVREKIGLGETATELLPMLRRGEALWVVGQRLALVQHTLSGAERRIVYTDARMARQDGGRSA